MAVLLIDMDAVVADLLPHVCDIYNKETGSNLDWRELDDWHSTGRTLGHLFEREGLFRNLPVIKDSQMVLRELSINHSIYFVTAAPTPHASMEKKLWVEEHFPFIGHKRTIPIYDKFMIKGDLLFDDSPVFLPKFPEIRVRMNYRYNRHADCDYAVNDWIAFLKLIEFLETNGTLKRNGE